jgi:putative sugar O-methyltransferase
MSLGLKLINGVLTSRGYSIVPSTLTYPWQVMKPTAKFINRVPRTASLAFDDRHLRELQESYSAFGGPAKNSVVWTDGYITEEHLQNFRGENGYVWQTRGRNDNEMGYALSYYYARANDSLELLDKLSEDDAFGVCLFEGDCRPISRDLLDSVLELNFLERTVKIAGKTVLDIGAGYGRLAHRAVTALPTISYLCTDAVAISTFVCEYYLKFRGAKARVIPLPQIERTLAQEKVDVAVNIHSWPECRPEAVQWWAHVLAKHRVRYIFVVTNDAEPQLPMRTNRGEDLACLMDANGYRLVLCVPKYHDPVVQAYGVSPATYFLWELGDG